MGVSTATRGDGGQPANDDQTTMLVRKIPDGSVIDHIAAGKALSVLRLLGNPQEHGFTIAMVMNVSSSKMKRKDIVKVEGMEVSQEQVQKLALIAPRASVNIVRSYRVIAKRNAVPPRTLRGILELHRPHLRLGPREGLRALDLLPLR